MKKIMAQAWKEFMLFRRDKLLILLAVLMPIVLMALAGGTQSLRLRNVPLLVYDYDNTPLSRTYLETYGAALTFRITSHPDHESPEEALNSWRGRAAHFATWAPNPRPTATRSSLITLKVRNPKCAWSR